jgi:DNA-binding CsgD family transcriptional regulator
MGLLRRGAFAMARETELIAAIYDAAIDPKGWDEVVRRIVEATKSISGGILKNQVDLETLALHLARAAAIHDILSRARATTDSLAAAVAAAGFALFLLTKDCRILFANAKAEELVRCETFMRCERGRLCATNPALTHHLHALARHGAQSATAEGEIGGTIELSRGEGRPPLVAHVIPLAQNRTVTIFDIDQPAAALFIVDPVSDLAVQIRRFAERFGLTPAETRVLGKIIGGNGLQAAAAQLKVTRATVRTHADHIFQKTGTGRQTELIRRFFETSLPGSLPNN